MTSEIRVNKLTNRIGLSTVTFADSGIGVTVTGRIDPDTDSARDLGTTSVRWRNAYVDTYYGDGSNLTGISAGTSLSGSTNNTICTVTGANAIQGESNLTYDGTNLRLGTTTAAISAGIGLMIADAAGARIKLCDSDQGVTASDGFEIIQSNNGNAFIYNRENSPIIFGTNNTERMRITHEGSVGIGTDGSTYELEVHDGSGAAALRMKDGANNVICDLIANSTGGLLRTTYNHPLLFSTNQVERLRIDTSGNVMIGRTSASKKFSIKESSTSSGVYFCQTVGGSSHLANYAVGIGFDPEGYPARNKIAIVAEGTSAGYSHGKLHFLMNNDANGSEATLSDSAMTIYSTGQVGINRNTTPLNGVKLMVQNPSNNVFYAYHEGTGNNYTFLCRNDRASGSTQATQIIFLGSGNTFVGDIRSTGSSTAYNTSSDYRLKENVTPISDGITRLKTLKPSRFNFKVDKDTTVDGFLAHEVTAVPEAVSGTKDEVVTQAMIDNGDAPSDSKLNDPIYQQLDYAKLTPLLTAALQEAITKIEKLEQDNVELRARVTNLEGN